MAFDITHAIMELEVKGVGYTDLPNLDLLREKYPDLTYLFEYIDRREERHVALEGDYAELEEKLYAVKEQAADEITDALSAATRREGRKILREAVKWLEA